MSRKVLDLNVSDSDVDTIMNNIIAQNPQLNAQIEEVHNESNVFLCEILRIYSYQDKAYVRILNNNEKIFCRLSHEILGTDMCIDYLPNGIEKTDDSLYKGKSYIQPFDALYGIVIKVRWENLNDENVLLGYVNIHDNNDLRSSNDMGEISIKSKSSIISVDDERINIMTPSLFINGLPYNEPNLQNYYDKQETDIIINTLQELITNVDSKIENNDSSILNFVGKFKINENGHLIVSFPPTINNIYSINENGHLIINLPSNASNPYSIDSKGHLFYMEE